MKILASPRLSEIFPQLLDGRGNGRAWSQCPSIFLLTPLDFIIPDSLVMHTQLPTIKLSWSLTALGFLIKSCDSDLGLGSKHCSLHLTYPLCLCYSTPPRSSCQNKIKHGKILLGEMTVWKKIEKELWLKPDQKGGKEEKQLDGRSWDYQAV